MKVGALLGWISLGIGGGVRGALFAALLMPMSVAVLLLVGGVLRVSWLSGARTRQ